MKIFALDRDGVINKYRSGSVLSVDEWEAIPGSLEAIAKLNEIGYTVVVFTNQSGISRGVLDYETLYEIHSKMIAALTQVGGHIDKIFFCPHFTNDNCDCRKPKPGMLHQIRDIYQLELSDVNVVGDSQTDIDAALAVGAKPMFVKTGKPDYKTSTTPSIPVYDDLGTLVSQFIETIGINDVIN